MFGKQTDSKKTNAPMFGFANASTRDQESKKFLSQKHVEVDRKCREGPGHIYKVPTALEKQVDARKQSAPCFSFSHTDRMKETTTNTSLGPGLYRTITALGEQPLSPNRSPERIKFASSCTREQAQKVFLSVKHVSHQKGTQGPPPGTYTIPGAMGAQLASNKPSSPAFSLSRTDRLKSKYEELSKTLPSVGQYDTWNSLGKQTLSPNKTLPAYGFGSSDRDRESRRFVSPNHVAALRGTASPSNYDHQTSETTTSFGRQALSRQQNVPSYGFGSAPKATFKVTDTPGPGSYD